MSLWWRRVASREPSVLLAAAALGLLLAACGSPAAAASRHAGGTGAAGLAVLDSVGRRVAPRGLPADCLPQPSGPPGAPYQLGVVGTIHDGQLHTGSASVFDVSASFCGVVTVVPGEAPCAATGSVSSPEDGQVFGSMSATLTLVPGMAPKVPFAVRPGTISGGFACASTDDGLAVHLTATVSASTGLFGLSCELGPITIPLSGTLTGPLTAASVTLRGDDFPVPAVAASPTCSGDVPRDLDAIAGLPIAAGGATVLLPATVSLYRPGT